MVYIRPFLCPIGKKPCWRACSADMGQKCDATKCATVAAYTPKNAAKCAAAKSGQKRRFLELGGQVGGQNWADIFWKVGGQKWVFRVQMSWGVYLYNKC